jgi:hypothetical protein
MRVDPFTQPKGNTMNIRSRFLASLIVGITLSAGSYLALAQPGGMPGHGAGHGPDASIEGVIVGLKAQLNLDTSQQLLWDSAIAQSKAARENGRASMDKVHGVLTAELAKAEPDFAAVAAAGDAAQAGNQALRKQVRGEWLKLYATFSPAQKAVVRDAVKARVARMETMRQRFQEHMQQRTPASGG